MSDAPSNAEIALLCEIEEQEWPQLFGEKKRDLPARHSGSPRRASPFSASAAPG
jgi:hypothetical protein